MDCLVAVLPDRIQAESVYTVMEEQGLPMKNIAILGRGYRSVEEYGLIDPNQESRKQAKLMAFWLVPFGFFGGVTFSIITGLDTFSWAGEIGNHIVGGLLGSVGGAMGSAAIGGGPTMLFKNNESIPYHQRLETGKYLVVVEGSQVLRQQALKIIRQFNPEQVENYNDPYAL